MRRSCEVPLAEPVVQRLVMLLAAFLLPAMLMALTDTDGPSQPTAAALSTISNQIGPNNNPAPDNCRVPASVRTQRAGWTPSVLRAGPPPYSRLLDSHGLPVPIRLRNWPSLGLRGPAGIDGRIQGPRSIQRLAQRRLGIPGVEPVPHAAGLGTPPGPAWTSRYDGPPSGDDEAQAIAVDGSGNVYVTGYSAGLEANIGFATAKYDASGNLQWVARYDIGYDNEACAIAVDASGNVYVTGFSDRGWPSWRDYLTIKYDANGVALWSQTYDGPDHGYDEACAIAVDAIGNVYVTGNAASSGGLSGYATVKYHADGSQEWVARYDVTNGSAVPMAMVIDASANLFVTGYADLNPHQYVTTVKFDSAGQLMWSTQHQTPDNAADAIAVDGSGNVYVTGLNNSGSYNDYLTLKYDSNGNEIRGALYDGPGHVNDDACAIALDVSGNVYVTGESHGSGANWDYATIKYDANLDTVWVRRYDNHGDDQANSIAVDASSNVYVTGCSYGAGSGMDIATVKYDATGSEQWVVRYDNGGNDCADAIALDPSGNVCVTGYSEGFKSDGTGTGYDYVTIKYLTGGGVVPLGWTSRAPLPGLNTEGSGGWVAYDAQGKLVYAAKGENTGDFYRFDPAMNQWMTCASIPPYLPVGKGNKKPVYPYTGCRGTSDGNGSVYMVVGNKTPGFMRYALDAWTSLPDVPANVFQGSDLSCANGYVYLLNGQNSEFYRYDVLARTWKDLKALPGIAGWGEGSWLVFDGNHTLYAQEAGTPLLWAYDINRPTPSWTSLAGMPLNGTSYAGIGGAGAWLDGAIYALKGSNTKELWKCVPGATPVWSLLDKAPDKVHKGGDICAAGNLFFAFLGNRTNQFWRYVRKPGQFLAGVSEEQAAGRFTSPGMTVEPNPMNGDFLTVSYSLPDAGPAELAVLDVAGRELSTVKVMPGKTGSLRLDLHGLCAGAYFVRLEGKDLKVSRKLVIER